MFKKTIKSHLSEIKSLKYKELAIDFGESVEKVRIEAEQVLPQAPATPTGLEVTVSDTVSVGTGEDISLSPTENVAIETQWTERFRQLAELHPAAAILESWLDLETVLRTVAAKHDMGDSSRLPTSKIGHELHAKGIWDEETYHIFKNLRDLRNTVVHTRAGSITPAQALEYDLLIRRLIVQLRQS